MATAAETAKVLEALETHCRPPLMTIDQRSLWLADWCNDLAKFPIEYIARACSAWRQSGKVKFPTPGELLPMVRNAEPQDAPQRAEAWRELTDDEYRELSLTQKIRHQRILASQAHLKAGPMFMHGRPVGPDELSQHWHFWKARAKEHEAEVKRLQKTLDQARGMAPKAVLHG